MNHSDGITPSALAHKVRLTARELVRVIVVLEAKRADLVAVGSETKDIDNQLRSARGRMVAGEYNIPPRGLR